MSARCKQRPDEHPVSNDGLDPDASRENPGVSRN